MNGGKIVVADRHIAEHEAQEKAALYVFGALQGAELSAFEEHLRDGCTFCNGEVEAFRLVSTEIRDGIGDPPDSTREKLFDRIVAAGVAEQPIVEKDGLRFVRGEMTPWVALPVAGVEVKLLSADAERSATTQLVYMAPGARYPDHRHGDTEDLYVLQGDLTVSGVLMKAGDYCRAEPGSKHTNINTREGCVFISTTSTRDEFLA